MRYQPGQIIGGRTLIEPVYVASRSGRMNRKWRCRCTLCGKEKIAFLFNIKKAESCGCLPRRSIQLAPDGVTELVPGLVVGSWTLLSTEPLYSAYFDYTFPRGVWICRCVCGVEKRVNTGNITTGQSLSCGCQKKGNPTHGRSNTPEYRIWHALKRRHRHVCRRWRRFEDFLEDVGVRLSTSLRFLTTKPSYMTCGHCEDCKKRGWERNGAWSTQQPIHPGHCFVTYNGETLSNADWARRLGISRQAFGARVKSGWNLADAVTMPSTQPYR